MGHGAWHDLRPYTPAKWLCLWSVCCMLYATIYARTHPLTTTDTARFSVVRSLNLAGLLLHVSLHSAELPHAVSAVLGCLVGEACLERLAASTRAHFGYEPSPPACKD